MNDFMDELELAFEASLDELEAPDQLMDEQDIEDDSYAVEYDDLTDDSDDFHGEDL